MSDEMRELTQALYTLKTCIAVHTNEMKHQTGAMKDLKDSLTSNGLAVIIVDRISKVFYKTTGLFGTIVSIVTGIAGTILYFLLK